MEEKILVIAEGKTKIISRTEVNDDEVIIISKDDITAGDGAKHDLLQGKAAFATRTTCNVFRLLKNCGIPVAFNKQVNETTFSAPFCTMLPYEVVIRREAHGSYCDRNPHLPKGHLFPKLVTEFFLKTKDKLYKGARTGNEYRLEKDDPLMRFDYENENIELFYPGHSAQEREKAAKGLLVGQKHFLILPFDEVFARGEGSKLFEQIEKIAKRAFLILEKAWQLEGGTLVDFKVEFGVSKNGNLLLADVIDNDSWRVLENGVYIDKQAYREGGELDEVAEKYRRVAEITGRFRLPLQQVIIWHGSPRDTIVPIETALFEFCGGYSKALAERLKLCDVTCSIHKDPIHGVHELRRLVQLIPDTVVIAAIGRSNGAGPTLSAAATVPVITVPASFKEFPEDVWSSLRAPSNVPVMTVLEPSNAALAALGILALRNPLLYMSLREQLEDRLSD